MSELLKAWQSNRPIFSRLPGVNGAYSDSPLADYLTGFWDQLLVETKQKIDDIPIKQLNPLTCDVEWLDFLAPLFGWDRKYWSPTYPVDGKRNLLANSYQGVDIWRRKGAADVLQFVIRQVGVRNRVILPGDFLIGVGHVGDPIGTREWEYTIVLPTAYEASAQFRLAQKIDALFGPAWCKTNYVFDDAPFEFAYVAEAGDNTALSDESGNAIEVGRGIDL